MSEKYVHQFNVKISEVMLEKLEEVAKEQGIKASELVRNWIREKINESRRHVGRPKKQPGD
jgi:metal-responsive CopG/Arc/MetJ family transcriptional regulator